MGVKLWTCAEPKSYRRSAPVVSQAVEEEVETPA
jgi:hypothetical protein